MLSTYYWSLEKDLYKFHEGNGYARVENKIAIWCLISISGLSVTYGGCDYKCEGLSRVGQ